MRTFIVVRTQFTALHHWPDCPYDEVAFLKNLHRHVFHVELKCEVKHDDRQLEFFMVKKQLDEALSVTYHNQNLQALSCEMMAKSIAAYMEEKLNPTPDFDRLVKFVSVFEDGENGAEIEF
jgi:6-pyruvoyl-tetrahydropterin synthase